MVRYHCNSSKEGRRQRMYEKALDAAATSPYAGSIDCWVLAGATTAKMWSCPPPGPQDKPAAHPSVMMLTHEV